MVLPAFRALGARRFGPRPAVGGAGAIERQIACSATLSECPNRDIGRGAIGRGAVEQP